MTQRQERAECQRLQLELQIAEDPPDAIRPLKVMDEHRSTASGHESLGRFGS